MDSGTVITLRVPTTSQPDLFDLAWAAGLFEGEGCWSIGKKNHVRACVKMTDFDVVERFHRVVGVGVLVELPCGQPHHKPQMLWRVTDREGVAHVLELLRPWLGPRRLARGEEILRIQAERSAASKRRVEEFCRNGHRRTAENTYLVNRHSGRPSKACRVCAAARGRAARASKKMDQQAETMREVLA